ncbi:hypothetical protein [Neobacillus sp. YIM B06451]|uniref:hypothetical protein n=1 Tax=Neobacillus sp. YIM B06451 TaxID=3070994 RepID=UPI002930F65A|nr:hypothetical protein [Neobacillus sp. YIM B06451]
MDKFINKVPGFRTGVIWKRIVACVGYPIMVLFSGMFIIFTGDGTLSTSKQDVYINYLSGFVLTLFIFVIPFILLTNLGGIHRKLPLLRSSSRVHKLIGIPIYLSFWVTAFTLTLGQVDAFHTDDYKKKYEEKTKLEAVKKEGEKK